VLPPDLHRMSSRVEKWRERADQAAQDYQRRAQRQPLLGLPLAFFARYGARQGILLASALAFRLFLWLLPLALLTAGILAAVTHDDSGSVESAAKTAGLTGAASQQVVTALRESDRSWVLAVLTGTVLFLWGTRTLVRALIIVNTHLWEAPPHRLRQKDVLFTSLSFAGVWVLLFACLYGIHRVVRLAPAGVVWTILVQGCIVSAVWLLMSLKLPDRRRDWLDLVPGAALVGFGLSIMNTVGRIYLPARFNHSSAIYGPLGIASVMLLWLLLIGQLIVSGALANAVWHDYRAERNQAAT
jgi:uncharacterized BrkB/YihY/UPF0761 family membrane protein